MFAITVSAIAWLVGFVLYLRLYRKYRNEMNDEVRRHQLSRAELALADRALVEAAETLKPIKCPACAGTGRTTSYQKQHVCPWCVGDGKVAPSVSFAFDRILAAIKHPFTDVVGTTNYKNKKIH